MNGLPYYPRYPRDFFEGTAGMSLELKGAYSVILDLIYMMGERGLPDDPQFIAGHLGCSVRKWNVLRADLIKRGKIAVKAGLISNSRADKEKIIQRTSRDKKAENARGPRKNKDLGKRPQPYTDTDTVEANASTGAERADERLFTSEVWSRAADFLARHDVKNPRPIIGSWLRDHPEADVFAALAEANRQGVAEPVSWIKARLNPSKKSASKGNGHDRLSAAMAAADEFTAQHGPALDRWPDRDAVVPLFPARPDAGSYQGGDDGLDQGALFGPETSYLRSV